MSQRELASAVGVSVGGMHYIMNALIEKGFVKLGNFTAAEVKRCYVYILTRKGCYHAKVPAAQDGRIRGASRRNR